MSVLHTERTKLLANALDRASTACVTVGIATPVAGYVYNLAGVREALPGVVLGLGVAGWFVVGGGLHMLARRTLGRLT
jgi:hypothetical protein